ncbi:sulfur carrier protein ThiS [Vallitalea pronyensis]|uniref:Sulfur carrier protein ThiS n=1 Tax=Vallitalea pronyensis TaxID=1348613 RepID=A0A8J8MKW3_9FIRM|nr:sulfur carrier protein ThiS [Vallitalea pronyensis]QUI23391.1 sulfur carrier protein ThiS [Vallitalea pronyensis]
MLVNGKEISLESGITIDHMLEVLSLDKDKVVVEINMEIIQKSNYTTRAINHDDKIEIVRFVGGG